MKKLLTSDVIKKLADYHSKMSRVKELQELANIVEETLEEFIPSEWTGLYLFNPKEKKLKLLFARGFTEEEKRIAEETAMERHPGKIFREKIEINIPDVDNDTEKITIDSQRSFRVKSRLYLPVMNKDECVGTFGVTSAKKNRFDNDDIELLRFICQLAGVVYSNIMLEEERQRVINDLRIKERAIYSSNNGIIITDATQKDNPIIFANQASSIITGYPNEELLGRNCRFLQRNDIDQPGITDIRNAIKEKRPCTIKLRNYRKDGSMFWNELSISPVFNSEGDVTNFIGVQSDVTDRIFSDQLLLQSNARLRELITNLGSGILVEDETRRIVIVNKEFCNMFGIPADPILLVGADCSQSAEQSKHLFKDPENFVKGIEKILFDKKLVLAEELELADGRFFERDYVPIYIDNNYTGHLWNYRDITERKNHEKEMHELKTFYEQTLNDLPGQIAVFDKDFKYMYVNPSSISSKEIREWIIGKDDFDFCRYRNYDISIAQKRRERLLLAAKEKSPIKFDEILKRENDATFYLERVISPILDKEGEVKQLLAYGVDVTTRINAEQDLLNLKNQLESVLNTIGEGIITVDQFGKIILVNDEIEKIFGWKREELLERNIELLVPDKYKQDIFSGIDKFIQANSFKNFNRPVTVEGIKKDKSKFPIGIRIRENIIGEKQFYTVAINDITELSKLIQDLETSNKALSDFAYIASHDLREPLRKISSFGSLLYKSISNSLDDDNKENLEYMIEGAKRMQQMIDDLLFYSRITTKAKKYLKINLDEVLNELVDFDLAEAINDSKSSIIIENTLGSFEGEKTQIKQLMQNLIGNAIKYRKGNENPVIKIRGERTSDQLKILVEDNGIGINEKYLNQIFEMFKRLHSKEEYEGSGIGLAVCKKITELYNGSIEVNSKLNVGSTFIIKLPIK